MLNVMRATLLLLVLALTAAATGCSTNYHYIVRTDRAPIYSDENRTSVVGRMERLADGYIGHREPAGDPVKVRYREITGYANKKDLRIFAYHNDAHARAYAVQENRREVILESKDWPARTKEAIREDRVENGMTREMVELAWGHPTATKALDGGGEQWTFERRRYDVYEDVHYDSYYPGGTRFYYGFGHCGPAWAYAYEFPYYEPRYYRTYYARTERRTATFGPAGTVTGWETSDF
jgi:hypothetical protein